MQDNAYYISTVPSMARFFAGMKLKSKGMHHKSVMVNSNAEDLDLLARYLSEGKLNVHIETMPLAEAAIAHTQIETGHTRGKIVLSCL